MQKLKSKLLIFLFWELKEFIKKKIFYDNLQLVMVDWPVL